MPETTERQIVGKDIEFKNSRRDIKHGKWIPHIKGNRMYEIGQCMKHIGNTKKRNGFKTVKLKQLFMVLLIV